MLKLPVKAGVTEYVPSSPSQASQASLESQPARPASPVKAAAAQPSNSLTTSPRKHSVKPQSKAAADAGFGVSGLAGLSLTDAVAASLAAPAPVALTAIAGAQVQPKTVALTPEALLQVRQCPSAS